MKSIIFILWFVLVPIYATAQTSFSGKVVDEYKQPVPDVSVALRQSETSIIGYGFSDENGLFEVPCPDKDKPSAIEFRLLGFKTLTMKMEDYRNGQTIVLQTDYIQLKEVCIRPDKITQNEDTLSYNVWSFKQSQDRSIADVIARMPGLEVKQDGSISFEGNPINKFYIEGMDLMGGKYSQASENINADMISSVQVIQNHQPIKTLKGVRFSEQAALNIVLKDNVKNVWASTLDVGMGSVAQEGMDYLYNGRLQGMMFGRKQQNLSMIKGDNTGKDIAKEVVDLATQLRDSQEEAGLLKELVLPGSEINAQRTTFNDSYLAVTNHLVKTPHDNDVRIQLDYQWNRKEGNSMNVTEYLDLDDMILSEENDVKSTNSRLKGDFTYKINKDKLFLNNRLHGNIELNKSLGITSLNSEQMKQDVRVRKCYLTEDIEIISRLKNGNSIEFSSQNTYSYLPGKLLTVGGFTESLDISAFETHNYAAFSHKFKGFTLNHRLGYKLKSQTLDVKYQDIDEDDKYTQQNIYVVSSLNLDRKTFKVRVSLKTDLMHRRYEDVENTRVTLQPNLYTQYDFSSTASASMNYNYMKRPNSLTALYYTPIFTSYRIQTVHDSSLDNKGVHSSNLAFNYKNPIKGLFLSLMGSWTRRTNETIYQSAYNEPVYIRVPTEQHYDADTYWISGNIAQSFYYGKTLVSLGYRQMWSDYFLLQKSVKTPWQLQNSEFTFKLSMQPFKVFSYELYSRMQSNKQVNRTNNDLSNERLISYNHGLSLFFFPVKNMELGVKGEFYHHSDKSMSNNMFSDMHISYQLKQWEFRLTCNNILNNHLYERRLKTSITDVYSIYRLRPREILFHASVGF